MHYWILINLLDRKDHITKYMKVAEDFIIDKVLPHYEKDNETLSTIVEQLSLEEKFNNESKSVVFASNYILRLTQVINEFALKNRKKEKDTKKYPGLLAIEMILSFNDKAEAIVNSIAKKKESQIYENYYEKIIKNSNEWQDNLLIISTEEKDNMSLYTSKKQDHQISDKIDFDIYRIFPGALRQKKIAS